MKKIVAVLLCIVLLTSLTLVTYAQTLPPPPPPPPPLFHIGFKDLIKQDKIYVGPKCIEIEVNNAFLTYDFKNSGSIKVTYDKDTSTYYVDTSNAIGSDFVLMFIFHCSQPAIINIENNLPNMKFVTLPGILSSPTALPDMCGYAGFFDFDKDVDALKAYKANIEFKDEFGEVHRVLIGQKPPILSKGNNLQPTENNIHIPATLDKLAAAQKEGKGIIPVTVSNSANAISVDTMQYLGTLSDKVGLEVTNGDAIFRFTGGFKINETGRLYYPLSYEPNSKYEADILKYFAKTEAKTDTCTLGGEYTLPKAVSITVKTTLPEGTEAYIYNYVAEPFPGKMILVGKAKVVNGKLTFEAKTLGEFMFTTEKI